MNLLATEEWVCPSCDRRDPDEGETIRNCVGHWPPVRMVKQPVQMPGGTPRARTSDPSTSHAAAASVTGLRDNQEAVLGLLRAVGPSTDEYLVELYEAHAVRPKQSPSGIRTRRKELATMEPPLVIDTGRKAKLKSGRKAIVWGAA